MKFLILTVLSSSALLALAQQEGYSYDVPPPEVQLNPRSTTTTQAPPPPPQPEGGGDRKPQAQQESHGHGHSSDDPLAWLRDSVPGEPETDYPIFNEPPETAFTCEGKNPGMYADVEARCQVWHQCYDDRKWSFLCPNGTIFNQEIFTCVWWFDFDCNTAEGFYNLNDNLYTETAEGAGGRKGQGNELPARKPAPQAPAPKAPAPAAPAPAATSAEELEPIEPAPVAPAPKAPAAAPKAPAPKAPAPKAPAPAPKAPAPAPKAPAPKAQTPAAPASIEQEEPAPIAPAPAAPAPKAPAPKATAAPARPVGRVTPFPERPAPQQPNYNGQEEVSGELEEEAPATSAPRRPAPAAAPAAKPAPAPRPAAPAPAAPAPAAPAPAAPAPQAPAGSRPAGGQPQQQASGEEGYNYPVPQNPLPIERPTTTPRAPPAPAATTEIEAPLPIYGAPARPFEVPEEVQPAANEPELANYLPPPRQGRQQQLNQAGGAGGRRALKRKGRRVQVKPDFIKDVESRIGGQAQLIGFKIEPVNRRTQE